MEKAPESLILRSFFIAKRGQNKNPVSPSGKTGFDTYTKMEAWVGLEPTHHGFANRSLSPLSTTPHYHRLPCNAYNIHPFRKNASRFIKKMQR